MQASWLWFLPANVRPREREDLRRALLSIAGCWIACAIALAIAATQAVWGVWQAALGCALCSGVCGALPFWVRRTGNWRAAAGALTTVIWSTSFAVGALTGGALVTALYALAFAAAIATITLGARAGVVLGVANVAVVGGVYALHVTGVAPAVFVAPETAVRAAMRGAFVVNVALAALVTAYEWLRAAMLRDSAESERRYRALADYGPDLIAEIDSAGRIVQVGGGGGALSEMLGGREALSSIHHEDRASVVAATSLLETQNSVRVGPLRWLVTSSETRWVEASLTSFRDGEQRRLLVVARDVTARMNLEAQLRQSQKMQAVGQLASGLAHDFNNLLMVVSGYAEALTDRVRHDREAVAALDEIQRASEQGASLTRRLLALSRPTALKRDRVDLNQLVRDNERMLRVLLGESIRLMLELSPGPALVDADAGEIEQVLVNLVANARDAMPGGGAARIAVVARGDRALLVVHDNGVGIDAAVRERIFEPFFTTKKQGHGTGLGLYVVYSIVSGLGGELELQTDSGAGTRVSVLLPLASASERAVATAGRRDRARGGSERVLVVEDRPELRVLLRGALSDAGYQVVVAADGVEALALDMRDPIDLVVSDVVMPRMGGVALVASLRKARPELRALFVSGHPSDMPALDPRDRLLRKPFLIRDLQRTVREVLDAS